MQIIAKFLHLNHFRLFFSLFFAGIILCSSNVKSIAQPYKANDNPFRSPVDFRILLSGNFAELRGSHFHTGIDIKTQGTIGHNIYAIADGYVSRIKVSPYGYGKALYIRHPNGYSSVYAHLESFNIQIAQYVMAEQYKRKKFALNLYPEKNLITVQKGEVIAKSGNSGGSLGPHLHFEIRKTSNEKPQNPLRWNFDIADNIAPHFHYLILYPLSKGATVAHAAAKKVLPLDKNPKGYRLRKRHPVAVADTIGIGVYVNDYLNDTYNRCGVHQLKLFVDEELIYHLKLDELSFAENRYILSHMDCALKIDRKIKAHKCFVEKGNRFSGYNKVKNYGKLFVAPGSRKKVRIEAIDIAGNQSELLFTLKGKKPNPNAAAPAAAKVLNPLRTNHFQRSEIRLTIPPGVLYTDIPFTYEVTEGGENMLSKIHKLHDYHVPVHKRYNVAIKTGKIPVNLRKKLYLAAIYENGHTSSVTSNVSYRDQWAHGRIRQFGKFAVMADTVLPEIAPVNVYQNKDMSDASKIAVKITDEGTGIRSYNGYIDGDWVLFEYDAKNDLITYSFDEHMPEGNKHELKIVVSDRKNNIAVKTLNFRWSVSQTNL